MNLESLSLAQLERRVFERKSWLREIIRFIKETLPKHGQCLKHKVHTNHTYGEYLLENFAGFSFRLEGAMSMFGLMRMSVSLQVHEKAGDLKQEVLSIDHDGNGDITVNLCIDQKKWEHSLNRAIVEKDVILAMLNKKIESENEVRLKVRQALVNEDAAKAKLLQEAARLMLR